MDPRFIIFSLPRCGSTTLLRSLNLHRDIRCLYEPSFIGVSTRVGLREALRDCWTQGDGLKHVYDFMGYPFIPDQRPQLDELRQDVIERWLQYNAWLLEDAAPRVIFLRRHNLLRRTVSELLGWMTDLWGPHFADPARQDEGDRYREQIERLAPISLDPDLVAWYLAHTSPVAEKLRSVLAKSGNVALDLWFEDLFRDDMSSEERRKEFGRVLSFLEREPLPEASHATLDTLLDPRCSQLNSNGTFARIGNLTYIEERFGGDATGWLLRDRGEF